MSKSDDCKKLFKVPLKSIEMSELRQTAPIYKNGADKTHHCYDESRKLFAHAEEDENDPDIDDDDDDDDEDADEDVALCKMNINNPSPEPAENEMTTNEANLTTATTVRQRNSISNAPTVTATPTADATTLATNLKHINTAKMDAQERKLPADIGDTGGGGGADAAGGDGHHHHHSRMGNCDDDETDVIGDLVGHFGKWQLMMTILLSLFQVPNTFHISSSVYQAANKNFWCTRPKYLQQLKIDVWRNISNSQDNCHQLGIDWQHLSNDTIHKLELQLQQHAFVTDSLWQEWQQNATSTACTAWEYETHDNVGNTWTSEWDLVCDKEYLKNVAEMFFLLGVATGGIISGYLSDKFGRKTMLFISAVLQTIFGLVLYFANSFELYITLRALLGLVSVSVTYAGLILAIEYVDGKWRTIAGMYNLFPLPISYMLISGIAYLTQDYQKLQLCIGIPGIFLCFLWFVVPESPRWLLVKGRINEVKRIIEAAAKFNGRILPDQYELLLKPPTQESSSQDFTRLFRSGYLRRISICFLLIWFTMNLVYYGLILNMSSFGGNVYLNSALAGLVEIPAIAIAIYIITKVGKKWLFCATLFCAGLACCCAAITEGIDDLLWLKITFLMIGKFTISAGNTIMPVYTAELYPTAIRNVGVGACNVAAGIALIITPYLSLLTKIENHLLMTLLTVWSLFGGFVVLFLPETMLSHARQNPPEEKC